MFWFGCEISQMYYLYVIKLMIISPPKHLFLLEGMGLAFSTISHSTWAWKTALVELVSCLKS